MLELVSSLYTELTFAKIELYREYGNRYAGECWWVPCPCTSACGSSRAGVVVCGYKPTEESTLLCVRAGAASGLFLCGFCVLEGFDGRDSYTILEVKTCEPAGDAYT